MLLLFFSPFILFDVLVDVVDGVFVIFVDDNDVVYFWIDVFIVYVYVDVDVVLFSSSSLPLFFYRS